MQQESCSDVNGVVRTHIQSDEGAPEHQDPDQS